jgi:nucleoside phosphorylase
VTTVAVIVAMDRELHPLVDGWTRKSLENAGKIFDCFENGDWLAVAAGIGCRRAETAARAVIEACHPHTLVSAGLAGALVRGLEAGSIVRPDVIVDAATGTGYCRVTGIAPAAEVLVSSSEVADRGSKEDLAKRFHARAVDMEAAGVAKVAQQLNVGFHCVKAISDEYDFALPPLNSFVDEEGNFQVGRFSVWAALRPWHWPAVFRLARNTSRATRALATWLRKNLNDNLLGPTLVTLKAGHFETANGNCQQS